MRITRTSVTRTCAVCERTLLMGERALRYAPHGTGEYVDVCPLCQDAAAEYGWVKEGSPTTPTVPVDRRRRGPRLARLFEQRRPEPAEPVATEPILRRLSDDELAIVEAADLFNSSDYRRTVGGIAKSLGEPKASVVGLTGVNPGVIVTVAWDISWYQYRVMSDSAQPVRLVDRGHDPADLERSFVTWNARIEGDGRVVPDIARV